MQPAREVPRRAWHDDPAGPAAATEGTRLVAEEVPIAMTYNRTTYAVMMATPADLEDFAIGFSLTERVVRQADQILDLEIITVPDGIELRMWIDAEQVSAVERRLRRIAGPTGCGLCGIDSLAEAARPAAPVTSDLRCSAAQLLAAMRLMAPRQTLNHDTRAVHAAAFWRPDRTGLAALREDVGRHNALDKLAGALARSDDRPGADQAAAAGAVLLTSRVSVELVQKASAIGAPMIAAVSAPTALALRTAHDAGITIAGIVRPDGFELFTHAHRIQMEATHALGFRWRPRMRSADRLVLMANQIGRFFAHQGPDKAPESIADHLRKFWDPRMRAGLRAHVAAGGTGLDPLPLQAVSIL